MGKQELFADNLLARTQGAFKRGNQHLTGKVLIIWGES